MSRISDAMKRAGGDPGSFGEAVAGPVGVAGVSDYIPTPAEAFDARTLANSLEPFLTIDE